MDPVVGLGLLGLTGYGAYKAAQGTVRYARRHRSLRSARQMSERLAQGNVDVRQQNYQRQAEQNRRMQLAILHLDHGPDPDFRRAANVARNSRDVPTGFRRRQYQRLRPLLVQHYRRCQQRGTPAEILLESLTELVEAMGLQDYEADYIRQEAERLQAQRPTATPMNTVHDFQQRLTQAQQEHDQRVQAIRSLTNVSDDIREQLLEAEDQRYQHTLFNGREH
ncbi:MAG: hypothetical protein KDA93_09630 [Planctomycetaceae bacterium]|nr:hypothetical protein [Planctomycetaceae bacterium]